MQTRKTGIGFLHYNDKVMMAIIEADDLVKSIMVVCRPKKSGHWLTMGVPRLVWSEHERNRRDWLPERVGVRVADGINTMEDWAAGLSACMSSRMEPVKIAVQNGRPVILTSRKISGP